MTAGPCGGAFVSLYSTVPMRFAKISFSTFFPFLLLLAYLSGCSAPAETIRDPRIADQVAQSDILNVPFRKQTNQIGCGIAVLSSILSYWDFQNELSDLERAHKPDADSGYSIRKLASIAQAAGLKAFIVKMDNDAVKKHIRSGRPVIVPIRKDVYGYAVGDLWLFQFVKNNILTYVMDDDSLYFNHYVALVGFDDQNVWIVDPAEGISRIANDRLEKMRRPFDHASLLVGR